jgi:hypothetical protein
MLNIFKKQYTPDLSAEIAKIDEQSPDYTPDAYSLEEKMFNFIFVSDTFKSGHKDNSMVTVGASGLKPFFPAYTSEKFSFLIHKKDKLPIPIRPLNHPDLPLFLQKDLRIRGEVYALRGCTIIELDNHKKNGVKFIRVPINVTVPYYKKKMVKTQTYGGTWSVSYESSKDFLCSVKAWTYLGRPEYWLDQLLKEDAVFDFDTCPVYNSWDRIWIKEYFNY